MVISRNLCARSKVAKERSVLNKIKAWELGKDYYDGNRLNGYGDLNMMVDGSNYYLKLLIDTNLTKNLKF